MTYTLVPILGAIVSAWIELSQPGESPMWLVAGAFFLSAPGVAAVAVSHSEHPVLLRVAVAILLSGVLFAIWILNVPLPTQPGVYAGGSSRASGAVMSVLVAVAWYVASGRALWWLRADHVRRAFAFGGLVLTILSGVAFVVGLDV